jgi:hypothetical protein
MIRRDIYGRLKRARIVRLQAWIALATALVFYLRAVGGHWGIWLVLAIALIALLESYSWAQRIALSSGEDGAAGPSLEQLRFEATEQSRKEIYPTLLVAALLLGSAFAASSLGWYVRPVPAGSDVTNVRFSDQIETPLAQLLRNLAQQIPQLPGPGGTATPAGTSSLAVVTIIVLACAVVVLAALLIWNRPAEAAPVGAAGLALAAIENAKSLSPKTGYLLWGVIVWLLVLASFILHRGIRQSLGASKAAPDAGGGKSGSKGLFGRCREKLFGEGSEAPEAPLLNVGVSILLLVWALVLVTHNAASAVKVSPPGPTRADANVSSYISAPLKLPAPVFVSGSGTKLAPEYPHIIDDLQKAIVDQDPGSGDLLLLFGSSDCRRIRNPKAFPHTNEELAQERADDIALDIEGILNTPASAAARNGLIVKTEVISQHDDCKSSDHSRAVFPFLIKSGVVGAGAAQP